MWFTLWVALLLPLGCSGGRTSQRQCTADYAVFYQDRVEFGHGEFPDQSDAPHFYELKRDGRIAATGALEQGSLSSVGDSSPLLLTWQAGGSLFWADLAQNQLESDRPDTAQFLSIDQQGSVPLQQASSVFRTAPGISSGVWVRNRGAVEESAWVDGPRQTQRTYAIASNIEAMNVGATDRGPQEIALGFNSAMFAVAGLESVDIAQRQTVFAPPLRQFEQFTFVDLTVSSDTSCDKVNIQDARAGRRDAPVLKGVTYITAVISHTGGKPDTDAHLTAHEVRVFARHADSTQWREVIEFHVPDLVTTAAIVASRNRGYLLIGTSIGLHGEPFRLNLSSGEIADLELIGVTPSELSNKLRRPPVAANTPLPTPVAGSSFVVKVDAAMTKRGPVQVRSSNPSGLTLARGAR